MINHRHLPHVSSFVTIQLYSLQTCTHKRRKLLACAQSPVILRGLWERSAEHDGWWVGHYILTPDHVHFLARRADCGVADGGLDADMEERQLPPTRDRPGHCPTYLATGLF